MNTGSRVFMVQVVFLSGPFQNFELKNDGNPRKNELKQLFLKIVKKRACMMCETLL